MDFLRFTSGMPTRAIMINDDIYLNVTDMLGNMQLLSLELDAALEGKEAVTVEVVRSLMDGILQLLVASQSPTPIEDEQ